MTEVTVLVGIPGSGKSYALERTNIPYDSAYFVYSTDAYIEQKAAELGQTYTEVFEHYIKEATEYMNAALSEAIESNKGVVWDQTNLSRKKREWILSKFPASYKKNCLCIMPPDSSMEWKLLEDRLNSRINKHIPGYVIKSMLLSFEKPSLEEGFDRISIHSFSGKVL